MKKILILSFIGCSAFFISCNNDSGGGMSATAKKNMEVNTAIMKAYEANDFSKMKDYLATDAVDHGGEKGDVVGADSIISEMKRYRAMMPDMKSEIIKEMADDEYVFTWAKFSGTMNGKMTSMSSVDVSKFKDGKAVEHWVFMNPADMMAMMIQDSATGTDSLLPTKTPPLTDTTNKK